MLKPAGRSHGGAAFQVDPLWTPIVAVAGLLSLIDVTGRAGWSSIGFDVRWSHVQEVGGTVVVLAAAVAAQAQPADRVGGSDRGQYRQRCRDMGLGLGGGCGQHEIGDVEERAGLLAAGPGLRRAAVGDPAPGGPGHAGS